MIIIAKSNTHNKCFYNKKELSKLGKSYHSMMLKITFSKKKKALTEG